MPAHQGQSPPDGRLWSLALVAVCLGYFMVIIDTTIVNVAVPALQAGLHADVAGVEWVIDGYLLMLAALVLSGGALADRLGAHRIFQIGLGVFVVASVICGVAPDVTVLIIARLIQGAGAAMSVPASLSLLRAAFPDARLRARAIGVWGTIAGVAAASGPILGGILVTAGSWRLVFFVNVPIGLAAIVLTARHVPAPAPHKRNLDPAAQALLVIALAALTTALIEGGSSGLTPLVITAGVVFLAATVAFIALERRSSDPMLPLSLFSDRSFTAGNTIGLLINLGFFGELFVLNLYLQRVLGYSALLAGVALLPQLGMLTAGSALSGRLTARMGSPRPALLIGLTVGGAGLLGLIFTGAHTSYLLLIGPLVATGFGMSFATPAAITAVIDSAPADRAGLAAGAINGARQLGGVIGIAVLGALVTGHATGFIAGLHVAVIIAAAAFWLGGVIATVTVRTTRRLAPRSGHLDRPSAPPRLNAPGRVDATTAGPGPIGLVTASTAGTPASPRPRTHPTNPDRPSTAQRKPMPKLSAIGKHIVITGGTSGVGLETARLLVAAEGRVFVVGSDAAKGAAAEQTLNKAATGNGLATYIRADLASLQDVRALIATITAQLDHLDVLINNAGIVTTERRETVDGLERTFAVNYLAPFALTNALLPLLRESAPSRVLSLTAAVEPIGRLPFSDLQREHHFGGLRAYSQSKKALAIYTLELARRERELGSGVSANVIDPFLVKTGLTDAKTVPLLFKLARPLMVAPATPARWVARAALDEQLANTTGRHFILGHRTPSLPASRNRRQASQLLTASTDLTTPSEASVR